jgi:cell wall-associated NlpC family hydrolase
VTQEDVVSEARKWVGTPFRHQGRLRSVGVDCAGLILGVGKALGALPAALEYRGYGAGAYAPALLEALENWLEPSERGPGRVALFRIGGEPRHLAFLSPGGMIHVMWNRHVCEVAIGERWESRYDSSYSFRGVA